MHELFASLRPVVFPLLSAPLYLPSFHLSPFSTLPPFPVPPFHPSTFPPLHLSTPSRQILASSSSSPIYCLSTSPQHRVEVPAHRWGRDVQSLAKSASALSASQNFQFLAKALLSWTNPPICPVACSTGSILLASKCLDIKTAQHYNPKSRRGAKKKRFKIKRDLKEATNLSKEVDNTNSSGSKRDKRELGVSRTGRKRTLLQRFLD